MTAEHFEGFAAGMAFMAALVAAVMAWGIRRQGNKQ